MAVPFNPSLLVPVGVGALVLWRMYSRIRWLESAWVSTACG
jgi:hypothetical protein